LGLGSNGTIVYEGTLDERVVAVKRMLLQHNSLAMQEIKFLQNVDLHPNLITYFNKEEDEHFVYLAIEKCEGNLDNLVQLMKVGKKDKKLWDTLPLSNVFLETPKKLYDPEEVRKIMW
jgi:serine/threonine-protein kinase/endoribonuclease IRE1